VSITDAKLSCLVNKVAAAQAELEAYLQGQVDAIVSSEGRSILLQDAQQDLLGLEAAQRLLAETQTAVLDAMPQNIAVIDADGAITAVNAAWRQFAGDNALGVPQFAIGANYLEHCPADIRSELQAVLRGERPEYSCEYSCHSPTERRWFRMLAAPVRRAGLTGAVIAHVNVTERCLAEESNRVQAFMLDNIGRAVISTDLEGRIVYANRGAGELYGWSPVELLGKNIQEMVVGESDRVVAEQIMAKLRAGETWTGEFPVRRRDGSTFLAAVSDAPLTDDSGRLVGIIGISWDITEKKAAEARLRHSESQLRLAGQMARLGWWIVDVQTEIVVWSDEVCAIHELPPGTTLSARDAVAYYTPESRDYVWNAFQVCCRDGTGFCAELELITARGRRVWVRAIGAADKDASGTVVWVRGALQDISELKAAAEENRRLATRLSTTLESITDAFCAFDNDWCYTYVNGAAERLLGLPREDLLGRCLWQEFPDTCGTVLEQELRASVEQATPRQFEHYYAGLNIWLELQLYPSGQGLAVYFRDVTEQREARQTARESQERFRLLSKATQDAIWDWDIATDGLWWNEGYADLFGYRDPRDSQDLTSWINRVHPADRDRVLASVRSSEQGPENSFQNEYRFLRADGSYAYVLDRAYILRDESGKPIRMIGSMTDWSERRKAEEKLAEQASLLDKAQDAIIVRDLEERFTYWNQSAERLYGYSAQEAIGRRASELFLLDRELFEEANARLMGAGEWAGELRRETREGREVHVESRWTLVRDDDGRPSSVLVIDTDVTERKKLEQQFLRAQRLESLGTLAGGIAHDLNNVLAPILLAIPLLQMEEEDPERRETLDTIAASAQRGAEMVKQVLTFARGVEGKRESVDAAELLRGVAKIANDTFLKNVEVSMVAPPGLPAVCGDSTQLHQVLLNLCVNARDAMPQGGKLCLSARLQECDEQYTAIRTDVKPGAYVCVEVSDTGVGMENAVLDKIFEPFFTTKDIGSGTGLGLSTSLAIVKSHGGFIDVDSQRGRGTKISVYLPCASHAAVALTEKQAPAQPPRGHGELVLIVEDEQPVREITQKTLNALGYSTLVACDGIDGLSLYATRRDAVALIITDMMMPGLDGPTMLQALLKMNPDLPVIGVSGVTPPASSLTGLRKFLHKPYTADALATAVAEVLAGSAPSSGRMG
jgi:PAS domain S-box-containing protein